MKVKEKVNIIKIIIDYQVKSFKGLFMDREYISLIHFKKFYRINITDMSYMFCDCLSLKELNLNNFNINYMFSRCSSLKKLNLNNFNTNNATDISGMFSRCSIILILIM